MDAHFQYRIFIFTVTLTGSLAFPPQKILSEERTRSHHDITQEGIYKAVANILNEKYFAGSQNGNPVRVVSNFFASDSNGLQQFESAIDEIVQSSNTIQQDNGHIAFYTVNAEQIERAHIQMQTKYSEIRRLSRNGNNVDISFVRQKIGEFLFTLQEFYSNTNWVEIEEWKQSADIQIYSELGIPGYQVKSVATSDMDMCHTCNCDQMTDSSCTNNIIFNGFLTSGYRSGQNLVKPARPVNSPTGKCSHGGKNDTSSQIPAQGGINKERFNPQYSPHYKLHAKAAEYAVKATENFISNNETGLVSVIPYKVFQKIFALFHKEHFSKSSFTFCIDTTGSMGDDITAVITKSIDVVSSSQGSANEPMDYVLTTFNDPANVTHYVTTDGYQMITRLRQLSANGGGDCPEFAMSGLSAAVNYSLPGSTIYFFSDADAKDANLGPTVINKANEKKIKIEFLLTGSCGRRRRRTAEMKRLRRAINGGSVYDLVAKGTGGNVYHTQKAQIDKVMDHVMKEKLPSAETMLDFVVMNETQLDAPFYIDESVTVVRLEITNAYDKNQISFQMPNGTDITTGKDIRFLVKGKVGIYSVTNPMKGEWHVKKIGATSVWKLNITVQSSLDFTAKLMETSNDGLMFPLTGNPITGRIYALIINVYNLGNGTVNNIILENAALDTVLGSELQEINSTSLDISTKLVAYVTIKDKITSIKIIGNDEMNNTFTRSSYMDLTPVTATLRVPIISDEVTLNRTVKVSFDVQNEGERNESFLVQINVTRGIIKGPSSIQIDLREKQSVNSFFVVIPTDSHNLLEYEISLKEVAGSGVIQSKKRKLQVTFKLHPECKSNRTFICTDESLNTANCSLYTWSAVSWITFAGVNVTEMQLTANASVNIMDESDHKIVNISGSCCSPSVQMTVYDSDGYSGQCTYDMSDGKEVRLVFDPQLTTEAVSTPEMTITTEDVGVKSSQQAASKLPVILGGTGGAIAAMILIISALYCKFRMQRKRVDENSYHLRHKNQKPTKQNY